MKNIIHFIFNGKKERLEMQVGKQPRVDELISVFNQITNNFKPSTYTSEKIFDILFLNRKDIFYKLIEIAKVLLPKGIELTLKIINAARKVICEIISYRNACKQKLVRVLYYLSDGVIGLTEIIPV